MFLVIEQVRLAVVANVEGLSTVLTTHARLNAIIYQMMNYIKQTRS